MSKFLTQLSVTALDDETWKLASPLGYQSDIFFVAKRGTLLVPTGFVTDFASVPRLPLAYLLAGNTAHEAAVVHDYLYQTHLTDRQTADRILLEAMEVTGVALWRRRIMYRAVRFCGWWPWRSGPKRFTILNSK